MNLSFFCCAAKISSLLSLISWMMDELRKIDSSIHKTDETSLAKSLLESDPRFPKKLVLFVSMKAPKN